MTPITGIDTHAHVFTRALATQPGRRYDPASDATPAGHLAMLARHGLSHGVLVQPSFLGTDNSFMLAAIAAAPGRLRGIAVVDPAISPEALADLRDGGIVGMRLNLIGQPDPALASAEWQAHLARVRALGWQIELHAEAPRLPDLLAPLLATGAPVVVDHFGRPDPVQGVATPGFRHLLHLADTGRLWVKLSGAYRNGAPGLAITAATELRRAFGPGRLLWGTDWPHTQFETTVATAETRMALDTWLPDPAERSAVLTATPAALFGFATSGTHLA